MKKGWIIFLVIFGLFVFFGIVFVITVAALFEDKPNVRRDTVLELNLAGLVTEHYPRDAFGRQFEGANLQMHDIRTALEMAGVDDRIRGVYLKIGFVTMGWAQAQDLRRALTTFKGSGKFVTAFLETCNEKSYYTALAADEIYLPPSAYVELNGLASEVPFYKRMFNKVGIQPEVDNIGEYKSAGDILKRDSMSPAHRRATQALLDDFYAKFVDQVVDDRTVDRAAFEAQLDDGIYTAEKMLEITLADEIKYEQEVIDKIKDRVHGLDSTDMAERALRTISVDRYAKLPPEEVGLNKGSRIALIYAIGTILPGASGFGPLFGRHLGSSDVIRLLESAGSNRLIKAIILRVDSPGGSSQASDEIWATIKKIREKKPVILSMGDVAASGGYWISLGCDAIVAEPLTITGSIGVVTSLYDLSGTYNKLGIDWETVKKGRYADVPTDKRPLTEDEFEIYKRMNRKIYQVFVQKTADARDMTWDGVNEVAQGRVWTGGQAFQHGLVDTLGGLQTALALAKEAAGIDSAAATQWLVYPQPKAFLESLLETFSVKVANIWSAKASDLDIASSLPSELKTAIRQIAIMNRMRKGEVMAIEPFVPNIN